MNPKGQRHFRGGRGFTLLELLAVISITAVLVALAGSALAKSKRKAESTLCQAHLKQWGVALALYLADDRFYPPTVEIETGVIPNRVTRWHDLLEPHLGARWPISSEKPGEWITGEPAKSPAACPGYVRLSGFSDHGSGSYGYNADGAVEARSGGGLGLGGIVPGGKNPILGNVRPVAESDVAAPSDMIAIADSVLSTANRRGHPTWKFAGSDTLSLISWPIWYSLGESTPDEVRDRARASAGIIKARHGGDWNVLFADGHVESSGLKELFNFRDEQVLRRWNRDHLPHPERVVVPND
jgi:prepilin-type N-terminal cleavage/methylation domain-containing protein/prepilin-type processing-associated H-X9-DG protein